MSNFINLNNNNFSLLADEISDFMTGSLRTYLNHRSQSFGSDNAIKAGIEKARIQLAKLVRCDERMLFFEGGSSRSDAGIISAAIFYLNIQVVITLASENEEKLTYLKELDHAGIIKLIILEQEETGILNLQALTSLLNYNDLKKLVSVSHADRISGELVPVKEIAQACQKSSSIFHLNTSLTIGRYSIDFSGLSPDFMNFGTHLLHGPESIGAIIINPGLKTEKGHFNLIHNHFVSTECNNISLIAGLEKALGLAIDDLEYYNKKILKIKEYFTKKLKENLYIEPINLKNGKSGLINLVPIPIRPQRFGQYLKEKFDQKGYAIDDLYLKDKTSGEEVFILPIALNEGISESEVDAFIAQLQQFEDENK
jgi:cysteine desulfurase